MINSSKFYFSIHIGNVNENTSRFGKADKTLGLPVTVKQIDWSGYLKAQITIEDSFAVLTKSQKPLPNLQGI